MLDLAAARLGGPRVRLRLFGAAEAALELRRTHLRPSNRGVYERSVAVTREAIEPQDGADSSRRCWRLKSPCRDGSQHGGGRGLHAKFVVRRTRAAT